jgi:hypothetical protein
MRCCSQTATTVTSRSVVCNLGYARNGKLKKSKIYYYIQYYIIFYEDRLCGLLIKVSGYRSRGTGFDSRRYQIFWVVVGLERGPFSLVSTTEELLGRQSSGSGLENGDYSRRDMSRWPRGTLYLQKLTLTSPTSGGRSVGIVRSRTQATEFSFASCSRLSASLCTRLCNRTVHADGVHSTGHGEERYRKYKRFKLGGGQD